MSRGSIREYAQAVQERYRGASKKERGKILDEFTQVTGYHRKAAIRLLRSPSEGGAWAGRRGRPKVYDARIVVALRAVWEATDRLCSRRLHPFLPEIIPVLRRCGAVSLDADTERILCQMSPSTIDRLLRPYKKNDSAYVEQKNWSVVRRLVGYDRYSSRAALECRAPSGCTSMT